MQLRGAMVEEWRLDAGAEAPLCRDALGRYPLLSSQCHWRDHRRQTFKFLLVPGIRQSRSRARQWGAGAFAGAGAGAAVVAFFAAARQRESEPAAGMSSRDRKLPAISSLRRSFCFSTFFCLNVSSSAHLLTSCPSHHGSRTCRARCGGRSEAISC
jgi:hypothetical protein